MPMLYWADGKPWHEANIYFSERADRIASGQLKLTTIESAATALHAYMNFLEARPELCWHDFPRIKAERPLTRYRGELIRARDAGKIAPSTTSARMSALVQWYRWVQERELLSTDWPLWDEELVGVRITDAFGFERTLDVRSTDLHIPNRGQKGAALEDGLLPVSLAERDRILALAALHGSTEFQLMLQLGFFTGMRLGSICDLKLRTLDHAQALAETDRAHYLHIGPGIRYAPVQTKYGVTGRVLIPTELLHQLRQYVASTRHLRREAIAAPEHRSLVFLTRFGCPYGKNGTDRSPSTNVDMLRLRQAAKASGLNLEHFHFHRTRATFATSLAQAAIQAENKVTRWSDVITLIRDLLLHKDEATSMRYITFVNQQESKAYWANEFSRFLFGTADASPTH